MKMKITSVIVAFCMLISPFFAVNSNAMANDSKLLNISSSLYEVEYNNPKYNCNTIGNIPLGTTVNTFLYNMRCDNPDYLINIFAYNHTVPQLYSQISQISNRRMYITVRKNAADVGEVFTLIPKIHNNYSSDFEEYENGIFRNDEKWNFTKSKQNVGESYIAQEESGNRYCRVSFASTGDSYPTLETGLLNLPAGSKAEMSFRIRNNKNTLYVRLRDSYSSPTNHYIEPVYRFSKTIRCFSSKNYITDANNENITIPYETWTQFKVILNRSKSDNSKNKISVYLNGETSPSKEIAFSNYSEFNWDEFKVVFGASPSNDFDTYASCDIDDFSFRVIDEDVSSDPSIGEYNIISYDSSGNEYSGAVINGKNKIKVSLKNASDINFLKLYAAEKLEDELIGISIGDVKFQSSDSTYLVAELNVQDAVNNTIELFVWDGETLKPLGAVAKAQNSKINKVIDNGHPRVVTDKKVFEKIKSYTHSKQKQWKTGVLNYADEICQKHSVIDTSSEFYVGKLKDFDDASDIIKKTAPILGMAYQLTGETKYSDKFYEMSVDALNHTAWNTGACDNLTVAYMLEGFSIGFDWCYNGLNESQRQTIAHMVIEKCMNFALDEYFNASRNTHTWSVTYTNHNAIPNSSFIVGAIAFAEYSPQLCQTILDYSSVRLKIFLAGLFPDGGWWEGASYTNLVYSHLAKASETLRINFGKDDVISKGNFITNSANFFIGAMGPTGSYNFAEQKYSQSNTIPEMLWLANVSNRPDVRKWSMERINFDNASNAVLSLVWISDPDDTADYTFANNYTRGIEHITLGNGNSGNSSWLSVLGGINHGAHKHLDLGSFVYDYNGVRWAIELGYDNYYKGYHGETSAEKIFYRSRTEGHNTLVINPSSASGGQRMNDSNGISKAEVVKYNLRQNNPYAVYDMTTAYSDKATSVKRGFRLLNNNIGFIVRDEFSCMSDTDTVYWYMHTDSQIAISSDKKTAILTNNEKTIKLTLCEDNLSFEIVDAMTEETIKAELLEYSKNNGLELNKQNQNTGIKKLQIKHTGSKQGSITVMLAHENISTPEDFNKSIDNWN